MDLRTIWYTCHTLTIFLALAAISQVPSGVSGTVQVTMLKIDHGTRTVGSLVTVKSEIRKTAEIGSSVQVQLYATLEGKVGEFTMRVKVAEKLYIWQNTSLDKTIHTSYDHLYVSSNCSEDLTRTIEWHFSDLPLEYDHLFLETEAYLLSGNSKVSDNTTLYVSYCETTTSSVPAMVQDSSIVIKSPGSYQDSASCNCRNANHTLAYENGTEANATAKCGLHANWLGCEMLQCWSGPHNIRSSQTKFTVNAQKPFECSYSPGFPTNATKHLWVDNMVIGDDYTLKPRHNGKEFWCEVSSRYTDIFPGDFGTTPQQIIVYYPPEKLTLNKFVGIEVNAFKILKYSYFANPKNGDVTTTFQKSGIDYHTPFSWGTDVSNGNQRIRELKVTVTSTDDYGSYVVCSSTTNPQGKDCVDLTISNIMKTTSSKPDTTTSSVTMDDQQPTTSGMPLLTKILIGVALFIFFLSAIPVIYLCRKQQRKKKERAENLKENVLYGTGAGHGTCDNPGGNPHNHITPATDRQEMDEVPYASGPVDASEDFVEYAMATDCVPGPDDVEYASTSADAGVVWNVYTIEEEPGGSRKRPIYAQVKKKKDGRKMPVYAQVKKKRGSADDRFRVETRGDDPETSTITYAAIDKSNKKRGKNAAADLYAVVNKPKSKE